MKQCTIRQSCLIIIPALMVLLLAPGLWHEDEYARVGDPSGRYTAIVTYQRYQSLLPAMLGQSGDKKGYIEIGDVSGQRYGKIPLQMISMYDELEWTEDGAAIKLVGTWEFSSRTYRYWNRTRTNEIVKTVR